MPDRFFLTTKHNCMPCTGSVCAGGRHTPSLPHPPSACWTGAEGCGRTRTCGIGGQRLHVHRRETRRLRDHVEDRRRVRRHRDLPLFRRQGAQDRRRGRGEIPGDGNAWMKPWHFTSSDGRFDVTMTPFFDNGDGRHRTRRTRDEDASGARALERLCRPRRRAPA